MHETELVTSNANTQISKERKKKAMPSTGTYDFTHLYIHSTQLSCAPVIISYAGTQMHVKGQEVGLKHNRFSKQC